MYNDVIPYKGEGTPICEPRSPPDRHLYLLTTVSAQLLTVSAKEYLRWPLNVLSRLHQQFTDTRLFTCAEAERYLKIKTALSREVCCVQIKIALRSLLSTSAHTQNASA